MADNRRKVGDNHHIIGRVMPFPHVRNNAVIGIGMVNPFKTAIIEIFFIKGRIALIHQVQIADAVLHALIHRIFQQMPAQAFFRIPLPILTELTAHKQKLFAGVGVHKTVISTKIGKFLPFVAGHFAEHGTFAVNNLIMRNRQNKVFVEGIKQSESQHAVVIFAVNRLMADIFQRVVHPAHIPFVAEPQAAH